LLSKKVKKVGDAEVIIKAGKGHRFVVIFRGKGLEGPLSDADPHREGEPIPSAECIDPKNAKQKKAAKLIGEFYRRTAADREKEAANAFLNAGNRASTEIPCSRSVYKLRPACLAVYPCTRAWLPIGRHDKLEGGTGHPRTV